MLYIIYNKKAPALKSLAITKEELEGALDYGMGFDGSSIEGYRDIE